MKLFKNIDDKFEEIGFIKHNEDKFGVTYYRDRTLYIQRLDLMHKGNGKHLIQSYDPKLFDTENVGNTCVGLTMYEAKLCIKKMKQMKWKFRKELR